MITDFWSVYCTFSSSLSGSPSSSWEKSKNATDPSMEHTKIPSPLRVLKEIKIHFSSFVFCH